MVRNQTKLADGAPKVLGSYMPKLKPNNRMFSIQQQLPRLPIPPLQETLDKYLLTVKPLLSEEEYENTKMIVTDFGKAGGTGDKLQWLLEKYAAHKDNWLADWWLHNAYLGVRSPVVVHSNPGIMFPVQNYNDEQGQLRFAAKWIMGTLDFKSMIDDQSYPIEHLGKAPLCMIQYYKILSSCRIPGTKTDTVVCYPPDKANAPKHIIVARNNHFFSIDVYGIDGKPLNEKQLHKQLWRVLEASQDTAPALGILTTEHRSKWGKTYHKLIKDKTNKASLEEIQRSIFLVCLDGPVPNTEPGDRMSMVAAEMLHGGGPKYNSSNRWFDKTLQFIFGTDGACGLNYEHAPAEGPPIASLIDHVFDYIKNNKGKDVEHCKGIAMPKKLEFNLTNDVLNDIGDAKAEMQSLTDELDLTAFAFKGFGKDFAKSQKVSPDAFIQVAMQLAYYSIHGEPCATYESGSTRRFQLGRTDTIRSCSNDSVSFCKAMYDSNVSNQEKANLFRLAIQAHRAYTDHVINGRGIDRHMLGLKLIAIQNGMNVPDIFMDTAYSTLMHFKMSTSQVAAKSEAVLCFGPVVPNGYGICYNPQPSQVIFAVSAFNSSPETDSKNYANAIEKSMTDIHDLLLQTSNSKL